MKRKLLVLAALFSVALFGQNNALSFDGANDYLFSYYGGVSSNNARTVEAWIRTTKITDPNSGGSQSVIVDWGAMGTGTRFTFNVLWNNTIRLEVGGNGVNGSTAVNDGNWHHVAVVYNPSLSSNSIKLFVDGNLDGQGDLTVSVNTSNTNAILVGQRVDNVNLFEGDIDEVRIWDIALSASQIASNYNKELCQFGSNLKLYFQFNHGTAGGSNTNVDQVTDLANGNDGTLINFALSGNSSNWIGGSTALASSSNSGSTVTLTGCNLVTLPSNGMTVTSTGTYRDTATGANGCDSIITYQVTVNTVDTSTTHSGAMISAMTGADSYQWVDCNNGFAAISGETNASFTASQNGSYAVVVTANGCTDTSACVTITGIGLREYAAQSFIVYPNPAANQHVKIDLTDRTESSTIRILDAKGAVYEEVLVPASTRQLEFNLKSGAYVIQHIESDNIYTQSLVVL